jgi:hypothetical protein
MTNKEHRAVARVRHSVATFWKRKFLKEGIHMFIEYVQPSPRAGVQEHVSQTTAAALIAAGFAKEVELTEEERKVLRFGTGSPSGAGHTVAPNFSTPVWNVINSPYTGKILLQRRLGSENTLFNGRPDKEWNCPPEIVKEFEARMERERLARVEAKRDRDRAAESYRG